MHLSRILFAAALVVLLPLAGARAQQEHPDAKAVFAETDRNSDGFVDREEFSLRVVEIYFFVDLDKSGMVAPDELDKALLLRVDMKKTDTNKDGLVSLQEFTERQFRIYPQIDTDKDGRLSLPEVITLYEALKAEGA